MHNPRIVFIGAHVEAEAPLRYLLSSGANVVALLTLTADAMRNMSGATDLAAIAASRPDCEVRRVSSANDPAVVDWISGLEPDLLLVIGWTRLIHEDLLRVPRIAPLGFHASLLPRYRGRAPINWALINGESETGNTLMVLAAGADEGDIVAQRRIPILFEDTCATLYQKVGETEVDMLAEVLTGLRSGQPLPRKVQNPSEASVMPKRRPEDGLIDWTKSARQLYDWVRAQTHPYPGAFTFLGSDSSGGSSRLWIWESQPAELTTGQNSGEPGTVYADASGWPCVVTGDRRGLRLISLQREGEPEISGQQALSAFFQAGQGLLTSSPNTVGVQA
jgi:methionyl-tRNA formyltransferase